ncbi:MAG TPA: GTPase ObgE [Candidatus Nitrosotenuis sp.]|nr:GTPase ObgE [Candidatus Nitrosotenuis sp.]
MFADSALISVIAGRGGDGAVSFRHEIYVDRGGPDGGDGGKGGDITFIADESKNTLVDFRYKPEVKAEHGERGGKRRMHGKNGENRRVSVPVGTIVYRDDVLIADLDRKGMEVIIAKGGDGGFGNAHFKSSTRQAPRVAEVGEKGDEFEARLELKLLADVGLVGFPNAGKSTFLSVVSNARPEIADYAFTTLTPNLGVADIDNTSLLIADIPGLIEGASEGKGLGDAFLKHVERTAVLLHLIDAYTDDVAAAYQTIRTELRNYSASLNERPEVVALTKTEGMDEELIGMQRTALEGVIEQGSEIFIISSSAHIGIEPLLRRLAQQVVAAREAEKEVIEEEDEMPTIALSEVEKEDAWKVRVEEGRFIVTGVKIEKFAARTDYGNVHSVNRLRDIMRKMGIIHELVRAKAKGDDIVSFGEAGEYQIPLEGSWQD